MKSYLVFLSRNKLYTAIQVFGLSVALGFVILLLSHVRTEFSVGKNQPLSKELYIAGGANTIGFRPTTAPELFSSVPQIKEWTRTGDLVHAEFQIDDEAFEAKSMYVDTNFFKFFDYELVGIDRQKVLTDEYDIIISESFARRHYPNEDPIGKKIKQGQFQTYTIVGVVEDFNEDDIFKPVDFLISMKQQEGVSYANTERTFGGVLNFVTLADGATKEETEASLLNMYLKQYDFWGTYATDEKPFYGSKLTRLDEVYWSEYEPVSALRQGNRTSAILLLVVALVLLVSAVFNYINLTVALISKRAKEIATRRLIGEQVLTVVLRSLCESFLFTTICFALGSMLAVLIRPWFEQVLDTQIYFPLDGISLSSAMALLVVVALVSGIVPAAMVSHFSPIDVIKGSFRFYSKRRLSNLLIVLQNLISTVLIAVGLTMTLQMHYLTTMPLGYNTDNIVFLRTGFQNNTPNYNLPLYERIKAMAQVKTLGWISSLPMHSSLQNIKDESGDNVLADTKDSWVNVCSMDTASLRILGIEIVEQYGPIEIGKCLITEECRDFYGISPRRPYFGKKYEGNQFYTRDWQFELCGVVNNFVACNPISESTAFNAHNVISILNFDGSSPFVRPNIVVELTDEGIKDFENTLKEIKNVCETLSMEVYGKDDITKVYTIEELLKLPMKKQRNTMLLIQCFMCLAVLISALGLYAFSISYSEQKSKQIALRKVMGASVMGATWELSRPFLRLALIGSLLAMPIAMWQMNDYLEGFYKRIDFPWWLLILTMVLAITISMLSIIWHSYSVAHSNPINSLKTE